MSKNDMLDKRTAENVRKKDVQVTVRMSEVLNKQIDAFCKKRNLKPSDGVRLLIELGLQQV